MLKGQVLLVDDEVTYVRTLAEQLRGVGFYVTCAYDGDEAVRILTNVRFDVAIVDVRMPRMDGISLLGIIKERWPDCAVIILTGLTDIESVVHAVELGAFRYIKKGELDPFEFNRTVTAGVIASRLARGRRKALEKFSREGGRLDLGIPPTGDSVPPPLVDEPTAELPKKREDDSMEFRLDREGSAHLRVSPKVLTWAKRGLIALLTWLAGLGTGWIKHKLKHKSPNGQTIERKGETNDQLLP